MALRARNLHASGLRTSAFRLCGLAARSLRHARAVRANGVPLPRRLRAGPSSNSDTLHFANLGVLYQLSPDPNLPPRQPGSEVRFAAGLFDFHGRARYHGW